MTGTCVAGSQVVRTAVKRMHVAAVTDRRLVHFRPCLALDVDSPHANDSVRAPLGARGMHLLTRLLVTKKASAQILVMVEHG